MLSQPHTFRVGPKLHLPCYKHVERNNFQCFCIETPQICWVLCIKRLREDAEGTKMVGSYFDIVKSGQIGSGNWGDL